MTEDTKTTEDRDARTSTTLSPSALNAFDICGRRGQFYKDPNQPRVLTMGTSRGQAWHKSMELFNLQHITFENDIKIGQGDRVIATLMKEATDHLNECVNADDFVRAEGDPDMGEVVSQLHTMVSTFVRSDGAVRWAGHRRLGVELNVYADHGSPDHTMPGIIDAVMKNDPVQVGEPTRAIGVDYKSASRAWGGAKAAGDPRKMVQPPLYAEAWRQMNPDIPMDWFAMDVMTVKGVFSRVWVPTTPAATAPFIDRWRSVSAQIVLHEKAGLDMPTNPDHMLCSPKWCDYWAVCPMGAEYDTVLANTGLLVRASQEGEAK